MAKVRTRFAPSPTGFLHLGSLRTVLFGYLLAKTESTDGKFILRIEDTDQKRKVEGAIEKMIAIINWVGINFDEGPHLGGDYGPYLQSERLAIYKKYQAELLAKDGAYPCFCSLERLEKIRQDQQKQKLPPRYDRQCRDLSQQEVEQRIAQGETYVLRQKMPLSGEIIVQDELRGKIKFQAADLEDQVLIKSDCMPTYQFASVVDDHLMEISHVIRGEEWIPSFPKNILLYQAFGWETPKFIHLALTMNKDGGKLSKRQGDVAIEDFKNKGYLPEALINFSTLLGWHPSTEQEIFSLSDLIKQFNYHDLGISPTIFDLEKLDYLNGYYIRKKSAEELVELCRPYLQTLLDHTKDKFKKSNEYLKKVVVVEQERMKKLSEIKELTGFFFVDELNFNENLLTWKKMGLAEAKNNLVKLSDLLEKIDKKDWKKNYLEKIVIDYLKENNL
ncbi:MAG: glutamate--tRNA ligase, partial [Candidatus Falkowbacteria bacterium]|nr:glutamate--tRNA ligase [Candidatus Falkowbacteria bacterium]